MAARALALAALLSGSAVPLHAQNGDAAFLAPLRTATSRPVALGGEVQDSLTARDPQLGDRTHFHAWRFPASAGQEIVATFGSEDFGGFVMLVSVSGDSLDLVESETSVRGGVPARLSVRLPRSGDYLLVANTLSARTTGRYSLSLQTLAAACSSGGPCAVAEERSPTRDPVVVALEENLARPISLGGVQESGLAPLDARLHDGSHFQLWQFTAGAGDRVVIDHESDDFDSYLLLAIRTGVGVRYLHENDDGPNGTDAQLAVELSEAGSYVIVANTFGSDQTGRYRLTLRSMAEACSAGGPCEPRAARRRLLAAAEGAPSADLVLGRSVEGRLSGSDRRIGDDTHFNAYRFQGQAGDSIAILLTSSDFDAYLYLARHGAEGVEQLQSDDDSGGGRNALITARLPETAEYLVLANGLSARDTGAYVLTLDRLSAVCASLGVCELGGSVSESSTGQTAVSAPARPIAVGTGIASRLTDNAPTLPNGRPFESWRFTGRSGDRIVIGHRSSNFDAYLYLYRITPEGPQEIATDDDAGGELNAEINVELPESGEYVVLAAALESAARGEYRLDLRTLTQSCASGGPCVAGESTTDIRRLQPAFSAPRRSTALGQPVSGTLRAGGPAIAPRGSFEAFRFRGDAGQRVVLTLDSDAFDTYLLLTQVAGGRLRVIGEDDDGGAGTNSRLVAVLPARGEYVALAASYSVDDVGSFSFAVQPCDDECASSAETGSESGEEATEWLPHVLAAERRPLPPEGVVEGSLTVADAMRTNGSHFHAYWFDASAGTVLRAGMQSDEFDTYLVLLRLEGDSLVAVARDDDGGSGTNALLQATIERSGVHVIVATSFASGASGRYALHVARNPSSR